MLETDAQNLRLNGTSSCIYASLLAMAGIIPVYYEIKAASAKLRSGVCIEFRLEMQRDCIVALVSTSLA